MSRFYVDDVPIRVFKKNEEVGVPYPNSLPMRVTASLWEASDWATRGGHEKIDWRNAPFKVYMKDFDIDACAVPGPANCTADTTNWWEGADSQTLTPEEARRYRWVRRKQMVYDYCADNQRFNSTPPPECNAGI